MKYLSVLVLLVVMRWTWGLVTTEKSFALADHSEVETVVRQTITNYIKTHQPQAQDIVFQQLYTETIEPNKELKAHFRYKIVTPQADDVTEQIFAGNVTLNWDEAAQSWQWGKEQVSGTTVNFQSGSTIKPESGQPPIAPPEGQANGAPETTQPESSAH